MTDGGDTERERLVRLRERYLELLLRADRHAAVSLIRDAVADGVSIRDIYLRVFQPSQHRVGALWQTNVVSVAQEHFCTAVTQLIMSMLYPQIFTSERNGRGLVATCCGGELHEIGVRMVADLFEMEGWDTRYLGANTPVGGVVEAVAEMAPAVVAISASLQSRVPGVAELVAAIRASEAGGGVRVLVGGHPFNALPDLWNRVGADGSAPDAESAVRVAENLLAHEPRRPGR